MTCSMDSSSELEQRLSRRPDPFLPPAMRSRVVDAMRAQLNAPSDAGLRPLVLLATLLVIGAGVVKLAGSATILNDSGTQTVARVIVAPDELRQFSDDPAQRQTMANVLTLVSSTRLRMLPLVRGRLFGVEQSNEPTPSQEIP